MVRDCWAEHKCDVYQSRRLEDLLGLEEYKQNLRNNCSQRSNEKPNHTYSVSVPNGTKPLKYFINNMLTNHPSMKKENHTTTDFYWNKHSPYFINFIWKVIKKCIWLWKIFCDASLFSLILFAQTARYWKHQWKSRGN